ncbi:MAG: Rossmann-like and DUF2520 domain-containing protein [Gemmatimonadales bacterium]
MTAVGIVGAGRAGVGLSLALVAAGFPVSLHGRRQKKLPRSLTMTHGDFPPWISEVDVVILAVPDDVLSMVAEKLGRVGTIAEKHVVLHLSGVLDHTALRPLEGSGCSLGSLHPLQSMSDPETTPQRLKGAAAAVEGDSRAVLQAEALAHAVGLEPFRVTGSKKSLYHAAAVFASNYLVVLADTASRLIQEAGVPEEDAWRVLEPLVQGTLENIRRRGAASALTGPLSRGDLKTVRKHLDALPSEDAALYRALGRATLQLMGVAAEHRAAFEAELTD